ncbi:MAG: hypothetical protein ACRDFX_06645 [Chloroflexota bacterium]
MVSQSAEHAYASGASKSLPRVTETGVASLALIAIGVIFLASYLPRQAPLWVPIALLAAGAALVAWNLLSLSRLQPFAWDKFFLVAKWGLLVYLVAAGMIEYAFVVDSIRGSVLLILTLTLAVFAVDVPMILAFTVARFQEVGGSDAALDAASE